MQFYADENIPLRTVQELRQLGHDVLTAFEDGKANLAISDRLVLARAIELNRIVLTLNRSDFKRLHRDNSEHAGIVICTEDPDRAGQAKRISEQVLKFVDVHGQLVAAYRPAKQPD